MVKLNSHQLNTICRKISSPEIWGIAPMGKFPLQMSNPTDDEVLVEWFVGGYERKLRVDSSGIAIEEHSVKGSK